MKSKACIYISLIAAFSVFISCKNKNGIQLKAYTITQDSVINISVDETFKPVIDEMVTVYQSSFPNEILKVNYKPETQCIQDLQNDSVRMVIIGRRITKQENDIITKQLQFKPIWDKLAYDAIAVIVSNTSKDSIIGLKELQDRLTGKQVNKTIILDGKTATSTVSFVLDSIAHTKKLGANVQAANNTEELIDIISKSPESIGMLGFSWINDIDDPAKKQRLDKIKILKVECRACTDGLYAKPTALTITAGQYNLIREINYVVKENGSGLGTKFANFMSQERGQLIFRRAHLVPAKMQFNVRTTNLSTK